MLQLSPAKLMLLDGLLPKALLQQVQQPVPTESALAESCTRLAAALTAIVPFVPVPVLDSHLAYPERGYSAGRYLAGTLLLVELVGLRVLAAQLAVQGRQGNEELTGILNAVFALLVENVEAHGGRLIKFGGESLSVFFDGARLGDAHAALAATAARALHTSIAAFATLHTSGGPASLRLRAAAHSGKLFIAELGDANHRELVVTGYASNRVAVALDAAAPGEVLLTQETVYALGRPHVSKKPGELYMLHTLDQPPRPAAALPWKPGPPSVAMLQALIERVALLQPYLPHGLAQQRIGLAAQGEFRPVTVLFVDFYAFQKSLALLELPALVEHEPAIVGRVLNSYYLRTQMIIEHYGGCINKMDMATFGNRLLAIFGAPQAHEDDPERAVRAALALRAAADDVHQEVLALLQAWTDRYPEHRSLLRHFGSTRRQRLSIATGTLYAGIVGTPSHHEYTVLGETVRLAEQMLARADDGEVLLTSLVRRSTAHLVDAEPLPPLDFEGLSVPLFRATRNGTTPGTATHTAVPLVGRKDELAQMLGHGYRALATAGTPGAVLALVGDAGVGKSRLADEALAELRRFAPSALIVRAECQGYEQTTPYAVFTRLLRGLLRLPQAEGTHAAALHQRLDTLVPSWSRFGTLLYPLLGLALPPGSLAEGLSAEQQRERLHELLVALCKAVAQAQPLIVLVDDVQWADASSHQLLAQLAEELPGLPLLLLLVYRPLPALEEPWCELEHCRCLRLRELNRDESETLLRALLGGGVPDALHVLIDRLDGTPFFIEETVRYLRESGALQQSDAGEWVLVRSIENAALPAKIEQLLTARLDRLSSEAREALQLAAVIGTQFATELVLAVSGQPGTLTAQLADLAAAALLLPHSEGTQAGYRFRHALVREVAYNNMLFARRRELHTEVAEAIERLHGSALDGQRVVLAQHYVYAEQWARAFPQLLAAAREAQSRYAHQEALALYTQSFTVAQLRDLGNPTPDRRILAGIHEAIGDTYTLIGSYDGARTSFEQALAFLKREAEPQPVEQAALQRKIGSTYEQQGSHKPALNWLERGMRLVEGLATDEAAVEHARILSETGWVHFRQGNMDQAQQYLEQALTHINSNDYAEQARVYNRLGGVAWTRGDLAMAEQFVQQSLSASKRSGDLVGQAKALNNLSILAGSQDSTDKSLSYSLQAMNINEQIGNKRELAIAINNIAWTLHNAGKHQQAHESFIQAVKQTAEVRDTYHQMRALLGLGSTLVEMDQWRSAEQAILRSHDLALQLRLDSELLEGYVLLADIALHRGEVATAVAEYQHGLNLRVDQESEEYGRFQRLAAKIDLARGNPRKAREILLANEALFQRLQNGPELRKTRRLLATLDAPQP